MSLKKLKICFITSLILIIVFLCTAVSYAYSVSGEYKDPASYYGPIYYTGWKVLYEDPHFTEGTEYGPDVTGGHETYIFGGWERDLRIKDTNDYNYANCKEDFYAIWYRKPDNSIDGTDYHSYPRVRTKVLDLSFLQSIGSCSGYTEYLSKCGIQFEENGSSLRFYNEQERWSFERIPEESFEIPGNWIFRLSGCIFDASPAELSGDIYSCDLEENGQNGMAAASVIIPETRNISLVIENDTHSLIYGPDYDSECYKAIYNSDLNCDAVLSCGIIFNAHRELEYNNMTCCYELMNAMDFSMGDSELLVSGSGALLVQGGNIAAGFNGNASASGNAAKAAFSAGIYGNGRSYVKLGAGVDSKVCGGDIVVSGSEIVNAESYAARFVVCESINRHIELTGGNVTAEAISAGSGSIARTYGVRYALYTKNINEEIIVRSGNAGGNSYAASNAVGLQIKVSGAVDIYSGNSREECSQPIDISSESAVSAGCLRFSGYSSFDIGSIESHSGSENVSTSESAVFFSEELLSNMNSETCRIVKDQAAGRLYYHIDTKHIGPDNSNHYQAYAFLKIDDLDIDTSNYDACGASYKDKNITTTLMTTDTLFNDSAVNHFRFFVEDFYDSKVTEEAVRASASAICREYGYNYFLIIDADDIDEEVFSPVITIKGYRNCSETTVSASALFYPMESTAKDAYEILSITNSNQNLEITVMNNNSTCSGILYVSLYDAKGKMTDYMISELILPIGNTTICSFALSNASLHSVKINITDRNFNPVTEQHSEHFFTIGY